MASADFKSGDLVWAKMKGYPPWPARIMNLHPNSQLPRNEKEHYVYFFGLDNIGRISVDHITPHTDSMISRANKLQSGSYKTAIDALLNYINEDKKDEQNLFKIKKDIDSEKPLTKVVRVLNSSGQKPLRTEKKVDKSPTKLIEKRPSESDIKENDVKCHFPKLKESFDRIEKLLFCSIEFREKNLMSSIEFKYVEPTEKKIGFISLGCMGQAIIKKLLQSGQRVTVWNDRQSLCDEFVKLGARTVNYVKDLIIECDITFCCASDSPASKTLIFGDDGVLKGLEESLNSGRGEKGYVEMTSIDPDLSSAISEAIVTKQGRYLEAPVCGTIENAVDGSLLILAAGNRKLFLECITCFYTIGKHASYISCNVGYGTKISQLLNMINDNVCSAANEAMALAERLNISHEKFFNILSFGPLNCQSVLEKCKMMAESNPPV